MTFLDSQTVVNNNCVTSPEIEINVHCCVVGVILCKVKQKKKNSFLKSSPQNILVYRRRLLALVERREEKQKSCDNNKEDEDISPSVNINIY